MMPRRKRGRGSENRVVISCQLPANGGLVVDAFDKGLLRTTISLPQMRFAQDDSGLRTELCFPNHLRAGLCVRCRYAWRGLVRRACQPALLILRRWPLERRTQPSLRPSRRISRTQAMLTMAE